MMLKDIKLKHIVIMLVVCVSVFMIVTKLMEKPNVNPCDCADLSSKAQIVGEWHLSQSDQKKLVDCESVYTYSEEAYEACVNKLMVK